MIDEILKKILKNEGGIYFRDGLSTKYGIAFEHNINLLRELGINEPNDIRGLEEVQAIEIYKKKYLPKCHANLMGKNLAYTHFDFFINKYRSANKILQEVINDIVLEPISVDGGIGDETLGALEVVLDHINDETLCNLYNLKRMKFYHELIKKKRKKKHDKDYLLDLYQSWLDRCTQF